MANPLILSDPATGNITGFNVYERNPHEHYSLVQDSIATRLEPIPTLNLLLTEQTLNEQRNLPCFWKQNKIEDDSILQKFQVNLPMIEKEEWLALCLFFEHWAKDGLHNKTLEVGTFIMFDEAKNRVFFIVPQQTVTAASVQWNNLSTKQASNLDGSITQTVAEWTTQYRFVGYCHSHNTMSLDVPSSTDDDQEVYSRPFGLHLLLSTFKWDTEGNVDFKTTFTAGCNDKRVFLNASTIVPPLTTEELNKTRATLDFTELNKLVKTYTPVVRYAGGGWSGYSKSYGYRGAHLSTPKQNSPYKPYIPNKSNRSRRWLGGCWCVLTEAGWISENLLADPNADYDLNQAWSDYFNDIEGYNDEFWPTDQLPDAMTMVETDLEIEEGSEEHLDLLPGAISEEDLVALELEFNSTSKNTRGAVYNQEKQQLEIQVSTMALFGLTKDEVLQIVSDAWDSDAKTYNTTSEAIIDV